MREVRKMIITDYRVKSVLRTYTRQLQKSKLARMDDEKQGDNSTTSYGPEKVTISEEARRRLVMEQIAKQAMEKVSNLSSEEKTEKEEGDSERLVNAEGERGVGQSERTQ